MKQRLPVKYEDMTPEQLREYGRARYHANIEGHRGRARIKGARMRLKPEGRRKKRLYALKDRYGVTFEESEELNKIQACPLCTTKFSATILEDKKSGKRSRQTPNVDHDHFSGKVRGVVCAKCNLTIGIVESLQKSGMLAKVQAYLNPEASNAEVGIPIT